MANLILPDPRMEMPELFEPGRKPIGHVVLRDSVRGCVFATDGIRDYTSKLNHLTSSNIAKSAGCYDFQSPSLTTGVLSRGNTVGLPTLAAATLTIVAVIKPRSYVSLSNIFGFGRDTATLSVGFGRYILQFNNNYYFWGMGADWDTGIAYDTDAHQHIIAMVKTGATSFEFYRDGILRATTTSLTGTLQNLTAGNREIFVGNGHPSAATGPDMLWGGGAIFDRALTAPEARSITTDFYAQIFEPA